MEKHEHNYIRILGIDPCTKGFGFAIVEGPRVLHWGVAQLYSKDHEEMLVRIEGMIRRFKPSVIAVEDVSGTRKSEKTAKRIEAILAYGGHVDIKCAPASQGEVRKALALSPRSTKRDVALALVNVFPELAEVLPPPKMPWQAEDERMNMFDAVGLASALSPHSDRLPDAPPKFVPG